MKPRLILLIALLFSVPALLVMAGEGHDHGDAPPAASGNGPRRLPDGSVFLPMPAQHQIGLRTLPVEAGSHPRAFKLSGRAVMDPNAGGQSAAHRRRAPVTPGPRGLPLARPDRSRRERCWLT
jgi:cobalt-zinc-cadmium efflux system membrane fusion protein